MSGIQCLQEHIALREALFDLRLMYGALAGDPARRRELEAFDQKHWKALRIADKRSAPPEGEVPRA